MVTVRGRELRLLAARAPSRRPGGRPPSPRCTRAAPARSRRGSRSSAATTASRGGGGASTGVSSPSRSSVVDVAPKQTVARYALRVAEVVLDEARRAAEVERQHAGRERIERAAVADARVAGQAADERHDVVGRGPGRLRGDEDAVHAAGRGRSRGGRARRVARPRPGPAGSRRRADARSSRRRRARGRHRRTAPVSSVASTPPGFVRTLTRVGAGDLLEQERHLGRVGLGEQVDQALGVRGRRAGRPAGRSSSSVDHTSRRRASPRAGPARARTGAAGRWAWCGRSGADSSLSGPPASMSAAAMRRVRGVALGWANVAVSVTMPAMQRRSPARRHRCRAARRARVASSATISQVAA